jgi:hypothetical protein
MKRRKRSGSMVCFQFKHRFEMEIDFSNTNVYSDQGNRERGGIELEEEEEGS